MLINIISGRGKILVKDIEIGTYDKNKKPICTDGKPQFTFPGHFKLLKGTVEVKEPVKDGAKPLQLAVSLEKNSFLVGVVYIRRGKILVKDIEIGTYDKNKKPICADGKPQFTFPGHFKLLKGTVEVKEPVKDGPKPLQLAVSLEKNSFLVGVVCEEGKSKNQFVPNEMW
ncbi:unnamed protein product [Strongylus vulgaris]|uniref:Uncharacterized protein n=1 Tax=Strongylus vulgaris TaxID=40348 RepID=A0A3P7JT34_STRVU|nr:unnamed protein product [Strongylus vulgaris]